MTGTYDSPDVRHPLRRTMPTDDIQFVIHPFDQDEYWLVALEDLSALAMFASPDEPEPVERVIFFESFTTCVEVAQMDGIPDSLRGKITNLTGEACMELVEARDLQHIAIQRKDGDTLTLNMVGHYAVEEGDA